MGTCGRWTTALESAAPECYDCSRRRLDGLRDYGSLAMQHQESLAVELEEEGEQEKEQEGQEHQGGSVSLRRRLASWPSPFPFDTIASGDSPTPCTTIDDDRGCFNSYDFYYATDYLCGNWILKNNAYGCCDGEPYRFSSQTCCFLEGEYTVKNANHWCACTVRDHLAHTLCTPALLVSSRLSLTH